MSKENIGNLKLISVQINSNYFNIDPDNTNPEIKALCELLSSKADDIIHFVDETNIKLNPTVDPDIIYLITH